MKALDFLTSNPVALVVEMAILVGIVIAWIWWPRHVETAEETEQRMREEIALEGKRRVRRSYSERIHARGLPRESLPKHYL